MPAQFSIHQELGDHEGRPTKIMLRQVLHEIENANAPITLQTLSHRLAIELSALQGMIDFWVRKGRLRDDDTVADDCSISMGGGCGSSCAKATGCAFVIETPRSYSLRL